MGEDRKDKGIMCLIECAGSAMDHIVKAKIERMIYRVRLIMHQIRRIAFGIISLQRKESGGAQDAIL